VGRGGGGGGGGEGGMGGTKKEKTERGEKDCFPTQGESGGKRERRGMGVEARAPSVRKKQKGKSLLCSWEHVHTVFELKRTRGERGGKKGKTSTGEVGQALESRRNGGQVGRTTKKNRTCLEVQKRNRVGRGGKRGGREL